MKHKFLNKQKVFAIIFIALLVFVIILIAISSSGRKKHLVGYANEIEENNTYLDKKKNLLSQIDLSFTTQSNETYQYQIHPQNEKITVTIPELEGTAELKILDNDKEIFNKMYNHVSQKEGYITVENKLYQLNVILNGKGEIIIESK